MLTGHERGGLALLSYLRIHLDACGSLFLSPSFRLVLGKDHLGPLSQLGQSPGRAYRRTKGHRANNDELRSIPEIQGTSHPTRIAVLYSLDNEHD